MEVQKVKGNCSMISISDNHWHRHNEKNFLKSLLFAINDYNNKEENQQDLIYFNSVKTVIMTTNEGFINRLDYWAFSGFRRAYSYKGNSTKRAYVMYKNFKKGLGLTLLNEGLLEIKQ